MFSRTTTIITDNQTESRYGVCLACNAMFGRSRVWNWKMTSVGQGFHGWCTVQNPRLISYSTGLKCKFPVENNGLLLVARQEYQFWFLTSNWAIRCLYWAIFWSVFNIILYLELIYFYYLFFHSRPIQIVVFFFV